MRRQDANGRRTGNCRRLFSSYARRMRRAPHILAFAVAATIGGPTQRDPWAARLGAFTDTPIADLQGVDCVSINAPRAIVWRLLVGPETAATWMLAGVPGAIPRRAYYRNGLTASKGDVLSLEATTPDGPRHVDLAVIALQPGEVLSFLVKSDEASLLDAAVARLTASFFVEARPDGTTDLTWVSHYDSNSPFAALLSPVEAYERRSRRLLALNIFKTLAESAARLPYPPLHDVPTSPQPTSATLAR